MRHGQRGVVLVLVLWVIVILSLIVYSLLFQTSTETTMTSARKKHIRAEALARAGLARAIVDLRNDLIFDTAEDQVRFDAEGDVWARPEEGKMNAYPSKRGEGDEETGFFNVRVYDEAGYFHLNRFSPQNMVLLQKIIQRIGYKEEDAALVAAAIVDWRDFDQVPALPNAPANDEGIAYAVIRGEAERGETDPEKVQPLVFRNEDFLTVDELLEVFGVTPELYFGPGTPEAEYYKDFFPAPPGDRFKIEERRRGRDEQVYGLRDYFTTFSEGTLNINTAPAHVLAALAEGTGNPDGDSWGERVVNTRRGNRETNITNDDAFKDPNAIQANLEVGGVVSVGMNLHPVNVASSYFRIVSVGEYGGVQSRLVAIVHRKMEMLQRNESFEMSDRAQERRDRNSGRTERRIDRNNELVVRYPAIRIAQMMID